MAEPILFNPDNRLLGTSTGDLSLYGGQSDPIVNLRPAQDENSSVDPAATPASKDEADAPIAHHGSAATGTISADALPQADGAGSPSAFLISTPASFAAPVAPEQVDTSAPAPAPAAPAAATHGSGTIVQPSSSPQLSEGNDATNSHLESLAAPAAQTALSLTPVLAPVAGSLEGVVTSTLDTATRVVDGTVDAVGGLMTTALDTTGGLVTTTVDSLGETVEQVGDTASDVVAAVPPITDAALGTVSTLTESGGDIVTATVGAVDDTLDGIAGADPVGGITTLVSLVSVSDMFDMHPTDDGMSDDGAAQGFDLLDSLADAPAFEPLLGGNDDHQDSHGLFDHGSDHPLGL